MPESSTGAKGWITDEIVTKYLHYGLAGGSGTVIALAMIDAVKHEPGFLPQLVNGGALYFAFAIVALLLYDRRAAASADLQARNVAAQETLAANVGALVNKSSERERETEILINHVAKQYDAIAEGIAAIRREQGPKP
ncbi:MAG: hypothetical protein ACLP1Y_17090 [Candidatus Acidiferrales bacterium]